MRNKIMTFACILLAGMMISGNISTAKAEENVASESAVNADMINKTGNETEELSEGFDTDVETKEEMDEAIADEEEKEEKEETVSSKKPDKNIVKKIDEKVVKKIDEQIVKRVGDKVIKRADEQIVKRVDKKVVKKAYKTEKKSTSIINYTEEEFKILVCVTFLEAGNQSYRGKLATANAVINRVLSDNFPNSIKGVIYQKYNGRYQFALSAPGGKLDKAMKTYGKNKGWRDEYEKACIEVCNDALAGKTATDRKYHFFRLHYKGIENWKPDGVKIGNTYYYNY